MIRSWPSKEAIELYDDIMYMLCMELQKKR